MFRYALLSVMVVLILLCVLLMVSWGPRLESIEDALRYRAPAAGGEGSGEGSGEAEDPFSNLVQGQTIYVPAYSHVYHQDGQPHLLTVTLSARNTDADHSIVLTSVRYHDTSGKELKSLVEKPLRLGPLATAEFLIGRDDTSGGSGANFMVEWVASELVTAPIVETVMIDTSGQQGISFVREGRVVKERGGAGRAADEGESEAQGR